MGELYIVEEAACWERKFMLFKVYLRQRMAVTTAQYTFESTESEEIANIFLYFHRQ